LQQLNNYLILTYAASWPQTDPQLGHNIIHQQDKHLDFDKLPTNYRLPTPRKVEREREREKERGIEKKLKRVRVGLKQSRHAYVQLI